MPTEQASATDADSPAAPLIAETPTQTNEDRQAIDPLLLFGSEFEEFADLLAPVEEGADPSATVQSALEQSDLSLLSKDADEIAALIDSASVPSAELPELTIIEQPELADPQPGPEQPENAVVPLNLQELVDGTARVSLLLLGRQCWTCRHCPITAPSSSMPFRPFSTVQCTPFGWVRVKMRTRRGRSMTACSRLRQMCLGSCKPPIRTMF